MAAFQDPCTLKFPLLQVRLRYQYRTSKFGTDLESVLWAILLASTGDVDAHLGSNDPISAKKKGHATGVVRTSEAAAPRLCSEIVVGSSAQATLLASLGKDDPLYRRTFRILRVFVSWESAVHQPGSHPKNKSTSAPRTADSTLADIFSLAFTLCVKGLLEARRRPAHDWSQYHWFYSLNYICRVIGVLSIIVVLIHESP